MKRFNLKHVTICLFAALFAASFTSCQKEGDIAGNYTINPLATEKLTPGATDARPAEPGALVIFRGEALSDVDFILVGGVEAEVISTSADSVIFKMPATMFGAEGETSQQDIKIYGKTDDKLPIYSGKIFVYSITIPKPNAVVNDSLQMGDDYANIKQSFTFVGADMDKFNRITVGGVDAQIVSQSPTELVVRILEGDFKGAWTGTDQIWAMEILGYYGEKGGNIELFKDFKLNTYIARPILTSVTNNSGNGTKFYLTDQATLTGSELGMVEKLLIDGVEATISSKSATSINFTIPEDVTFYDAKDCEVVAIFDGGDSQTQMLSTIKVYPFYYWKDVRMSVSTSTAANYDNGFYWNASVPTVSPENADSLAFYCPDYPKAVSTNTWLGSPAPGVGNASGWDENAKGTPVFEDLTTASKIKLAATCTKEKYMSVRPYFFIKSDSKLEPTFVSPPIDANTLNKHRYFALNSSNVWKATALPSAKGTPIITFRKLNDDGTNQEETDFVTLARNGAIETVHNYPGVVAKGLSLAIGLPTDATKAVRNSVLLVQWTSYEKGDMPTENSDILKTGVIVIKEITDFNESTGQMIQTKRDLPGGGKSSVLTNSSKITFDCYWPKNINPNVRTN